MKSRPNRALIKAQTLFENVHWRELSESHQKNFPDDRYEIIKQ